ncbi:PHP domain-containing protein [Gordonia insulae]|uniref:DNA polymerase/3'-5' exonuclease PolX n=1 Tax=Gordonia insulae TaxID=2420509 RepID=A0A3G8JUD9_9ACTN|nr:PHP domain-containing protein [Gordonia insulae]AZG48687.1 DNA polymerase/3'-5' exonuclease PolX [Gordonia insulae]
MNPLAALDAPVDPVVALTRIAWLLERDRQSTYRVEAFRKAARAARRVGADELARKASARTLTDISGIGKTTAAVIVEAVDGGLPGYLADLQASAPHSLAGGGQEIYRAVRGDLHAHTEWSDGGASLEEMAAAATALGHDWLAITDHSPRLTVANGLSAERLAQQLEDIGELNRESGDGARILTGIEVDILDDGTLDQTDEMLGRLDIVTASVHSKLRMDAAPMTRRMVAAVSDPRVNVLGHCTGRRVTGGRGSRPPSVFDARAVFTACAEHGTAVEINSRPERVDPPDDLIELARDLGCLFAIDSDAHAPGQLDFTSLGAQRAEQHGIDADRIVTTWPVDRVLDWAASDV